MIIYENTRNQEKYAEKLRGIPKNKLYLSY